MTTHVQRLAIVVSHPTQYYAPWFRWLANHGWNLRVFYLWDFGVARKTDPEFGRAFAWDVDLLSGYDHEFVPNISRDPGTHHFRGLDNPPLRARLVVWQPDAVLLFGYNFATHLRLVLTSRWPLIFRGDSHLLDRGARPFWKRLLLNQLYARFGAITCVGEANRDYFRASGVPEKKLFFAPHCVDAAHFTATPNQLAEAARIKAELGLTVSHRVVLFAGKLIPKKQPLPLLEAFLSLNAPNTALVFVGDGEQADALHACAARHPGATIRFLPFANQSEMPSRYLLADVFALPSCGPAETWGLAVNEAMHLGRPCLVSDRVGCQRDLVTEGVTGWVFPADSAGGLRHALQRALETPPESLRAAIASRIAGYSYEQAAAGLARAINSLGAQPV